MANNMFWFDLQNVTSSMVDALAMYKAARAPRDYKREYAQYHSKQEQIDNRSTRNKARRKLGLAKGDPREVDHKVPLSKGGGNGAGNLRAVSLTENRRKFTKTAAIPSPPIDNYTGRWTTVGSGRLGISTPGVSDVDYMVPVEDLESTEGFSPFQQYTSAYKKDFDMPGYRGGSIVALPEGPYKTIDDSYAAASKEYTPKQLRSMKESKDKIDFYRDIGVVLTDDAMKLHNKTANDNRERTYAEMRDAIRGFAAKQNIDPEKAMLVAGGAGYMHGMRDEVNDLDFFHDDLPDFVQEPYGRFDMDGGPGKDLPEAAKQYQMMHGMRVQTPESMLAFYQRLNRPKDQEKIEMLKAHLKTASDRVRHTIVTGHSGSGKSTLSRKLSKETGLPIYAMDDDPGIRDAFFNYQKTYAKTHDGRLDLSPKRRALEDEIERRGIRKALELATPHIIEGSHFLRRKPEEFKEHKLIMVNPSAETIAFQRTNRKKLKDLARGREWNPDIERQSRFRGQQLYDMYEEGGRADNWRNSSLVEKRASTKHHLITGVPGAGKSTVAKRIAKEKGLPLFEIDSDPRFNRALQLIDEGKMSESNALQRQMFRDAVARKDPHVIEGAQIMLDPALARQHELQILDDSADVLAPRWAKREAGKHRDRALKSGRRPVKDEAYYDKLYRGTVYPRYQKQLKSLKKTAGHVEDRAHERTNFTAKEIEAVRSLVKNKRASLKKGTSYSVRFPGRGSFVVGDVGKGRPNHVVKTVLGPGMKGPKETIKAAMFTPASALRMMQSKNKLVRGLGNVGSKLQIAATKPGVVKALNAANESAFAGPQYAAASATASGLKSLTPSKFQNALEASGLQDVATNHGDALTPLGMLYGKAVEYAPQVLEAGANMLGG